MTDIERLEQMERVVREELETAGIVKDTYRCKVIRGGYSSLEVGYWPGGGGQSEWSLHVTPPHNFQTFHFPAELKFNGQITPLSLQIVRLLDCLMWEDRKRESK